MLKNKTALQFQNLMSAVKLQSKLTREKNTVKIPDRVWEDLHGLDARPETIPVIFQIPFKTNTEKKHL